VVYEKNKRPTSKLVVICGAISMALLEVRNLTKKFGGLTAVNNVSFDVYESEILGLIGPNGAGKTTTYNMIAGVYKPDSGVIKFKGEDITGLKPHQICRKRICRTFQIPSPFNNMSVLRNVMVGALYGKHIKSKSMEDAKREAIEILQFLDLAKKKDVFAKNLTVIDRKRLELAKSLATKPELLLLDEVVAGLNPVETEGCMELLKKIREAGTTLIVVEHVMKAIMGISHRIVVLHHGEKIAEGTPKEIVSDKKVIEAYLGEEYLVA